MYGNNNTTMRRNNNTRRLGNNNANKIATLEKKMDKLTSLIQPVANHVKPIPKQGTFIKVPLNEQTIEFLQNMEDVPNNIRNTQYVFGNHGSKHGRGFYSQKNFLPKNINTKYNKNRTQNISTSIVQPNNKKNNNKKVRNNNILNQRKSNNFNQSIIPQHGIVILPNNKKNNQIITF